MSDDVKLVIVYSGNIVQAEFVKSLLEGAGIRCFLKDEFIGTIAPWYAAPGGVGAVKVVVREDDLDKAEAIVQDFLNSSTAPD
jgi:hypothetical protein